MMVFVSYILLMMANTLDLISEWPSNPVGDISLAKPVLESLYAKCILDINRGKKVLFDKYRAFVFNSLSDYKKEVLEELAVILPTFEKRVYLSRIFKVASVFLCKLHCCNTETQYFNQLPNILLKNSVNCCGKYQAFFTLVEESLEDMFVNGFL